VDLDKPIALAVHQYLLQADVIVADITDGNPNVMYELGFAQALGKPILPVVERQLQAVPPVVRGRLFLVYDRENPADAVAFVADWVTRHLTRTAETEELVG
jgi:nucleoside 2-deoxyribosyltransferase